MYKGIKAVSSIQEFLGIEPKGKPLSAEQIEMLRGVYGDSIDYSKVEIKEAKGLIGAFNSSSYFVVGNTIYVPPGKELKGDLLVHEMAHVWQYQNGGVDYMGKAVAAQWWGPEGEGYSKGYYYKGDILSGKPFERLNPEQQAELMQDACKWGVVPPDFHENQIHQYNELSSAQKDQLYQDAVRDGILPRLPPNTDLSKEAKAKLVQYAANKGLISSQIKFYINGVDYTAYVLRAQEMIKAGKGVS